MKIGGFGSRVVFAALLLLHLVQVDLLEPLVVAVGVDHQAVGTDFFHIFEILITTGVHNRHLLRSIMTILLDYCSAVQWLESNKPSIIVM